MLARLAHVLPLAFVLMLASLPSVTGADAPLAMEQVGPAPHYRPTITNVQIVDLDRDGKPEVLVCDAQRQAVIAYRRTAAGKWDEQVLGEDLIAPAHATVVDLDGDGDDDVVVSVMGDLYPDDEVVGSLVLLENRDGKYRRRTLLDDVRRVVDAQGADFDGDGDVDLAVAVFGYARGQILWLENKGGLAFQEHELMFAPGTIHVPVADYDGDGDADIAAIVSQEEEEVWGFENLGQGRFKPRRLWMTVNFDVGSAGLVQQDLDGDGDADLLLPLGDNLEDSYATPQPYHGCLWFENQGGWKFEPRRISSLPGTYAAAAGDLDGDQDCDVLLCSMVNHWNDPAAPSLVWLENDGRQRFTERPLAVDPIKLVTVACGDLNADGRLDVVAGGLHMHVPFERMGRVNAWLSTGRPFAFSEERPTQSAEKQPDEAATSPPGAGELPPPPDMTFVDEITRGEVDALREELAAEVAAKTATARQWLELGQTYHALGFFAAAGDCYAEARRLDPNAFAPAFWCGVARARLGELSEGVDALAAATELGSPAEQAAAWYEIGRCRLRSEQPAEAEQAFRNAGDHAGALAELAKLCLRSERPDEAEKTLDALARRQSATLPEALLRRQLALLADDEPAVQRWRDFAEYATRPLPLDFAARTIADRAKQFGANRMVEQSRALIQQRQFAEAAALLERVVAADARTDALVMLAGCRQELGQHEEALEELAAMDRERGFLPVTLLLTGDAQLSLGRTKEAVATWERLASLRDGDALRSRLADAYEKLRMSDDVSRAGARRLQESGIAALRGGRAADARRTLGDAVRRDPRLARGWYYLGEARRISGDDAAALIAYRKAVELEPAYGRALDALARLSDDPASDAK